MKRRSRTFTISVLALVLSACGGGGSGGSTTGGGTTGGGTPTKTPTQILADAKSASTSQLSTAARTLADNAYSGSTEKADLDIALAQQVYRMMFDENILIVPEIAEQDIDGSLSENGAIDATINCDASGKVNYDGQFKDDGTGRMTMVFDECLSYYNQSAISGVAAISIDSVTEHGMSYSMYLNGLSWEPDEVISLYGVLSFNEDWDADTGVYTGISGQYLTAVIGDETYKIDAELSEYQDYESPENTVSGRMSVGSRGYIDISLTTEEYANAYLTRSTVYLNDDTYLNFANGMVAYITDTDGDGLKDAGRLVDLYEFIDTPITELALQPLGEMSSVPEAWGPDVESEKLVRSSDIEVSPGHYFDYETPKELLTVTYNWYVNDVLVEGVHGNILPAYTAGPDDYVQVSTVVGDETYIVESSPQWIWLEDTPAVLTRTDVPETISAGDTITFGIVLTDADIEGDDNLAALTHAPEGATIDADGNITWQVPDDVLFNQQVYRFGISNKLDPNAHIEETFELTVNSDQGMPLFRTGVEVPRVNKSQWVVDIDGDGVNELLSTDNYQRIFLLSLVDGKYEQTWAYPYVLSEDEDVKQVLSVDRDQNGIPEILAITTHGIWLIDDLSQPATQLFETESFFFSALLADTDNDGAEEIIYSLGVNEYYEADRVVVAELDDALTSIFTFDVDGLADMAVGNVDEDASLELVLNNGLVYDLSSGANEWYLGTGFGDDFVTVGDLNGDGTDEIIGVESWSTLFVFNAVNKTQLTSQAVDHTCDVQSFNLYNDATDELVISDCQWGMVRSYNLGDSALELLWEVDLQDHGSTSLTMGDIDNDGENEVLWGSGISSSGADILVTADITATSATVKLDTTGPQLDSFSASGWAEITSGDERGVFLVPSINSSYSGLAVATLTKDGTVTVDTSLSANWNYSNSSQTVDFNKDGAGDILLPTSVDSADGFGAFQLSNMSAHWVVTGDWSTSIQQIKALDVNGDGYEDAIIADGNILKVFDLQNQLQIATYSFGSAIRDFDIRIINGVTTVVVAQNQVLQVLTLGSTAFTAQGSMEVSNYCDSILIYGEEDSTRVACWNDYADENWYSMTLQNSELSSLQLMLTDYLVFSIEVDPTNANRLLVLSNGYNHWYSQSTRIHSVTLNGDIVWSSPLLVGNPDSSSLRVREQADGKLEILLGTSAGMHWIH